MENMNQVIEARIESKLAHGFKTATEAIERLSNECKIAKDYIHRIGSSRYGNALPLMVFMASQSGVSVELNTEANSVIGTFDLTNYSIKQAAEKLSVPPAYLEGLGTDPQNEWSRNLAAYILNEHSKWTERKRILVRTVGTKVRGILSDSYRRLDSGKILLAHVEEVYNQGGVISGGHMDETRVWIESLLPTPLEIETVRNGIIKLMFGMRWSTSDYGDGALEGRSFLLQPVCWNGACRESILREVHLGKRLPDNLILSETTYRLDTETQASAVRDITRLLYSNDTIKERLAEIKAATDMVVDPNKELKNMIGRITKREAEGIGKVLMVNDPMDGLEGESTLFKLTQGIGAYANRENVSQRRRLELQEIAGSLLDRVKS